MPLLLNYLQLRNIAKGTDCVGSAVSCTKDEIVDTVRAAADPSRKPRIPCRYVGVWSSVQPGRVHRITLQDDGRYAMAPSADGSDRGYTSTWAIEGGNMVWHHDQAPAVPLHQPFLARQRLDARALDHRKFIGDDVQRAAGRDPG